MCFKIHFTIPKSTGTGTLSVCISFHNNINLLATVPAAPITFSMRHMEGRVWRLRTTLCKYVSSEISIEPMKSQNVQLELFSHVNTVSLTFILRAREGRIGNYNVQLVLDAPIRAVGQPRVRQQELVVNFEMQYSCHETCCLVLPWTYAHLRCRPKPSLIIAQTNSASSLVNSTGSSYLVGVTYE